MNYKSKIKKNVSALGDVTFVARVRSSKGSEMSIDKQKSFTTLESAEAWASDFKIFIERNNYSWLRKHSVPVVKSLTLKEALNEFIAHSDSLPNPYSKTYIGAMKTLTNNIFSNTPIAEINAHSIIRYCISRHAEAEGGKMAKSTLNTDIAVISKAITHSGLGLSKDELKQIAKELREQGLIGNTKVRKTRFTNKELAEIKAQLMKYSKSSKAYEHYAVIFELLIATTLRRFQILNITWQDLNPETSSLRITAQKNTNKSEAREDEFIPMSNHVYELFNSVKPEKYLPSDRIFKVNKETLTSAFIKAKKALNLEHLRLADTRREGASYLLEQGVPKSHVKALTTHRDYKTLDKHYTKLDHIAVAQGLPVRVF